ncbi:hypothetical protein GALMADRAFT_123513 [Galerina marginata CBS 339.88]|uniref:SET domain-containing protein n=1 Tax=Galerina marginata (strain CBS 339.88) TaxID=685588 RepID=A0A067SXP2_GALM3|nr:hypothetical protein GALMADRAFT_123513 [Galerina marginata CBS 339.88]
MVLTTIPPIACDGKLDPDGHTQWLVHRETKAKLLNAPGYPRPVPKPDGPSAYVVRSTHNMGMGMFATRDIKIGEFIFAERPLFVGPRAADDTLPDKFLDDRTRYSGAAMWMEHEKVLETAFDRMTTGGKSAIKSLMDNGIIAERGRLYSILNTNASGITTLFDGQQELGFNHYIAVSKLASRINHSCTPNVTFKFDLPSFSVQFTVMRPIKAGEQLFTSYGPINKTAAERQAQFIPHGFVCDCPACVNATPESDKFRKEYKPLVETYLYWMTSSNEGTDVMLRHFLGHFLHHRDAMIKEGVDGSLEFAELVACICRIYIKLGMQKEAELCREDYMGYKVLYDLR